MATYTISNRTLTENLTAGKTYTLSNVTYKGYEDIGTTGNAFIPTSITPADPAQPIAVSLKASGVLKLTVQDSNTDPVDITNATISRVTDITGATALSVKAAYASSAITIAADQVNNTGQCDINFLPWKTTEAPDIFIKIELANYETKVIKFNLTTQQPARQAFSINAIVSQVLNFSDEVYTDALPTTNAAIDLTLA